MSGHRPRKRFGQHFLRDPQVIERIVAAIDPRPHDPIIEIGPGEGVLTAPLLAAGSALQVVEIDRDLVAKLAQRWPELTVINADALKIDFGKLAPKEGCKLVGNLPYNVSTPILFHALSHAARIKKMVFMLQQEVVDRMVAVPGSKAYGRLSVMLQYRCQLDQLFSVPATAFRPPPKVESAVIELRPYSAPPVGALDEVVLAKVVQAAFGQRRKTLANALKSVLSRAEIIAAGVDPGTRAERLEVAEFVALADAAVGQN